MRSANPARSNIPTVTFDTQAFKASAAAMAAHPPSGDQDNGVFNVLNKLPLREETVNKRGQLDPITDLLTSLNKIGKRDEELEVRQLGLVKSAPEAVGQISQVTKLLEGLPIKRSEDGILGGLGGLGGVLGGSVKRDTEAKEEPKIHASKYTENALKGFHGMLPKASKDKDQPSEKKPSTADSLDLDQFLKRESSDHSNSLHGMRNENAKRDTEAKEVSKTHKPTYTEKALKGFKGMIPGASETKDHDSKAEPSAAASLGLEQIIKRSDPVGVITNFVTGILAKREDMELDENMLKELEELAKRSDMEGADEMLEKLSQIEEKFSKRQLGLASSLATGMLSNAGAAAGKLAKMATGKLRRSSGDDAGKIVTLATATMGNNKHHEIDDDTGATDYAEAMTDSEEALGDAHMHLASRSSSKGTVKGALAKRQVPPIAGSDAFSIVKGLIADPNKIFAPVTKGVLVGGKSLSDIKPAK